MKPGELTTAKGLDTCLLRMEAGDSIDEIVQAYAAASPEKASEIREILQIAEAALPAKESLRVPAAAQRASRELFLAHAQKLQQQPGAASRMFWLRLLRFFQHNFGSIAFAAATIVLLFVGLSSLNALPGDRLYPVKLAAEQAEINLTGAGTAREEQISIYDARRAEEVANMIRLKRSGTVRFGGYLERSKEPSWQVAGIQLQVTQELEKQAQLLSGAYVEVKGLVGNQGVVQVESLTPRLEPVSGMLTSIAPDGWQVDRQQVKINANTVINGKPKVGDQVLVQAVHLADSTQMLAVSVEIIASNGTGTQAASPQVSLTAAATATLTTTPEPTETITATGTPTILAKPIGTEPPGNNNSPEPQSSHEPEDNRPDSGQSGSSPGND